MPALRPRHRPRSPYSASQTTSPLSSVLTQRKRESAAWRFPLLDPAGVFACHLRCSFQLMLVRNSFTPFPPNGSPLSGDCLQPERLSPPISRASSAATSLRNSWEKGDADEPYQQVSRPVFLDTGGIDGRQARLRREIDRLKACWDRYAQLIKQALAPREEHGIPLPAHVAGWQRRVKDYETRIKQCWKTYKRRNRELAHLASNLLILLALLYDCRLICGENLTTLKTEGRGRGVRGRFRNWRNNTTVRGELWRVLTYKCHLLGIRARQVEPRGTTHTCPHCHQPAKTYASSAPAHHKKAIPWGPWLCCSNPECLWDGARD